MRRIIDAMSRILGGKQTNTIIGATGSLVQKSNVMGFFVVSAICISVVCCAVMYVCASVPSLGNGLGYMSLATLLLFLVGAFAVYVYLMLHNPSALRSESYIVTLSQMAVEAAAKGLPVKFDGDGIIDVMATTSSERSPTDPDNQRHMIEDVANGNEKEEENQ